MSTWRKKKGDVLVGKRIDPTTEAGKEIARIRELFATAEHLDFKKPISDDDVQHNLNASMNVPIVQRAMDTGYAKAQRAKVIRKRIQDVLDSCLESHGVYPKTIGVPRETFEEVRAACAGHVDVIITLEKT